MRYLVVLFIGLFALPIHASVKVDVFSSEVILDKNESDAEKVARVDAMKQVIIKASGDKNANNNPVVKKALSRSGSYLSQLGYGEQEGQKTLQMVFNPAQIQLLLNQAELPFWSSTRANLVVWVIKEGSYGREIFWEHTVNPSLNKIKLFSDLRGLPITVPVGDIEDVTNISAPDLWGGFTSPISTASQRYTADAVLVIRIQDAADGSYVRWTLYDEKPQFIVDSKREPIVGNASGDTSVALEKMIDEVSNYYATKSAIKSTAKSENTIVAQFMEVDSALSFFTLEKMLNALNSVASVDVEKIVGDDVTFSIHLLSSENDFSAEVVQSRHIRKLDIIETQQNPSELVIPQDPMMEVNDDGTTMVKSTVEQDVNTPQMVLQVDDGPLNAVGQDAYIIEEVKPLLFEWIR